MNDKEGCFQSGTQLNQRLVTLQLSLGISGPYNCHYISSEPPGPLCPVPQLSPRTQTDPVSPLGLTRPLFLSCPALFEIQS